MVSAPARLRPDPPAAAERAPSASNRKAWSPPSGVDHLIAEKLVGLKYTRGEQHHQNELLPDHGQPSSSVEQRSPPADFLWTELGAEPMLAKAGIAVSPVGPIKE